MTFRIALLVVVLGTLGIGFAVSRAGDAASSGSSVVSSDGPVAAVESDRPAPTATTRGTPVRPTPTVAVIEGASPGVAHLPVATSTVRPAATPTPAPLISEVLPAARTNDPTPVRGGSRLPVPEGTTVVFGGCASDGRCYAYNFYWAPTREAVLQNGEGQHKVQHEMCHAHQHWSINGGGPLDPSDYDLGSWYATTEGQSFVAAVAGLTWPWTHSAVSGLEDFAWTCAYWYLDPAYLLDASPERYRWAADNLP